MKTTISKDSILKPRILFLTFTALLSILFFTSCSDNSETLIEDDTALIEKIELAAKETVSSTSLPTATETTFDNDLVDSSIEKVELAKGLGYKVSIFTDNLEREEARAEVYFTTAGKQLEDRREKAKRKRRKCFKFVLPLTLFMPDNSTITINKKEDWALVREWYKANPNSKERPEFVFPLDIELKDGTVQTLLNIDELKEVKKACKAKKDKRKCFKLVLPVSFTMPDTTVITVNERADFKELREWHIANPDVKEKGSLNFPVDITYRDGTTKTINNETEMEEAKEDCKN